MALTEHKTLALSRLWSKLSQGASCAVLDLGPASQQNLEFLSGFCSEVYVADLFESSRSQSLTVKEALPEIRHSLDAILAWDLLDYLSEEQTEVLVRRIVPHCKSGTLLFAMISFVARIPARPRAFRILDSSTLLYDTSNVTFRRSPRHHEPKLLQRLAGFEVEASFVLRSGVREYLFAHR